MLPHCTLNVSGRRIQATYSIHRPSHEIDAMARAIAIEQTIEFPENQVANDDIRRHIIGRIESVTEYEKSSFRVVISYAEEVSSYELTSLLNMLIGNSSMHSGIQLEEISCDSSFWNRFTGPRFGTEGIRRLTGVKNRPLLCGALKPIGLSAQQLAQYAYQMALGGADMIKDDHGLIDQPFARAEDRIALCSRAVAKANQETGRNCLYFTNVTGAFEKIITYAKLAKNEGAGGLMVIPGLIGFSAMKYLSSLDEIALPIMNHPSMQGFYIQHPSNGLSAKFVWGQLARLSGTDLSAFPHFESRFAYTESMCQDIIEACTQPMGALKTAIPTIGGGMRFGALDKVFEFYGEDVVILVGGDLHSLGNNVQKNTQTYVDSLISNFTK